VTPENAAEFLAAGSVALGVGSSLVSKGVLEKCDWAELTRRAKRFVDAVQEARSTVRP
jgi:2-dehydro-3-deoxyphosphogluconate aldolase/(4S)-4-hydroxy-2-oxoglutarate aldolase